MSFLFIQIQSTSKEMTPARNATDAHVQDFVANDRDDTTHPQNILTLHSLTALFSEYLMFSVGSV